jgi:hypothetical protein
MQNAGLAVFVALTVVCLDRESSGIFQGGFPTSGSKGLVEG